jgi:hypothetical protein
MLSPINHHRGSRGQGAGTRYAVKPDIVKVSIPNKFVVGFGMEINGYWRNLPGLWAIRTEDLKPRDG